MNKTLKKTLSIILTVLMIVTTVPFAFAAYTEPSAEATEYPVWVAGTQVTDANMDDVLGDGTVSYKPSTNTLTLKNAEISYINGNDGIRSGESLIISGAGSISGNHGIYLESGNLIIDGDVELINAASYYGIYAGDGSITITENGSVGAVSAVQTIRAKGDIVIDGTVGKLTATGSSGIFSEGNITIRGEIGDIDVKGDYGIRAANGTVTFSAGSEVGNITSNTNAVSAKNINISGKVGNLTATNCIHATDTVSIAGTVGDITATGNGIYAENNITINGNVGNVFGNNCGIVTTAGNIAISGTVGVVSSISFATINADGKISVSNTSVVADGKGVSGSSVETTDNGGMLAVNGNDAKVYGDFNLDKYIGTETIFENLTLISDAKLTVPSGETLEVEISLNNGGTIDNQGTLKLPAGTAKNGISGGILYIGEKGFQWNDEDDAYRCINGAHTEDTETGGCSDCGETISCKDCGRPAHEGRINEYICLILSLVRRLVAIINFIIEIA